MGIFGWIREKVNNIGNIFRNIGAISSYKETYGIELFQLKRNITEKESLIGRTDKFSIARTYLIDKFNITKKEASKLARDIAMTNEVDVPIEHYDTWSLLYPERV